MTTKTGIIYLQRDKMQMYSPYLPNILEFRFVPELIRDFDLVSKELLENLLKVFLANNKVPASSLVIVISDSASFIKDFVSPPPVPTVPGQPPTPPPSLEDLHNLANQYLEHVPFEIVASKVFPLATGVRAYATNQEVYEGLKAILEKQGFIIQAVLPGFVFGPNLSNRPNLDGASIAAMMQKIGTLQGYNLLKEVVPVAEPIPSGEAAGETEEKDTSSGGGESAADKPENKKVMMAVAISAIVLIVVITGIVIFFQFQQRPYVPPPAAPKVSAPTVAPQAAGPVTIPEAKDLTAQITSSSSSASTAAVLRSTLTAFGFKSVVPQTQEGLVQTVLVFSPKVTQQARTVITDTVKQSVPTVLVQDNAAATVDVTIILGK